MSDDQHISVVPNITGQNTARRNTSRDPPASIAQLLHPSKMDPDVRRIMETGGDDFNVHQMPHKKTKEETVSESTQSKMTTSSWAIIVMAIVVILLICAIAYLVIKYNEAPEPPKSLMDNLQRRPAPIQPVRVTKPAPTHIEEPTAKAKSSKAELEAILQRTKGSPPVIQEDLAPRTGASEDPPDDQMVKDFYKQMDTNETDSMSEQTNQVVKQLLDE